MKKKTKILIVVGIICIIGFVIGTSYALWVKNYLQQGTNVVNSSCFEIVFSEDNSSSIQLDNAFPIRDDEGKKLKPYTFILKNNCDSLAQYQLNLETTKNTSMRDSYIKVMVNEKNPVLLTDNATINPTISNGRSGYNLEVGVLQGKETKNFSIRIWMDENVGPENTDAMNGTFESKVTITTAYYVPTLIDTIKSITPVTTGTGLYSVNHSDADITYTTDTTAINNLKMTELRYAGKSPNNYVTFNGEEAGWRIMGLVNTPEGQRVKLVRNESIGDYVWDSSDSSVNRGLGINEWSQADLMTLLNNGPYYNRTSGTCYNGQNNATTPCDFSNNGLTLESKNMIDTVTWNLGTKEGLLNDLTNFSVYEWYNYERSNNIGKTCSSVAECNDTILRTTSWKGQVGLMYPSDYAYTTSGGVGVDREFCLTSWKGENWNYHGECRDNAWIDDMGGIYFMNPVSGYGEQAYYVLSREWSGVVIKGCAGFSLDIGTNNFPTIYLKTTVKVNSGNGTIDSPYILS